ncbi:hypothetical protein H632_c3546p0, partial [Helicosporidium sp. ATCC 50920]
GSQRSSRKGPEIGSCGAAGRRFRSIPASRGHHALARSAAGDRGGDSGRAEHRGALRGRRTDGLLGADGPSRLGDLGGFRHARVRLSARSLQARPRGRRGRHRAERPAQESGAQLCELEPAPVPEHVRHGWLRLSAQPAQDWHQDGPRAHAAVQVLCQGHSLHEDAGLCGASGLRRPLPASSLGVLPPESLLPPPKSHGPRHAPARAGAGPLRARPRRGSARPGRERHARPGAARRTGGCHSLRQGGLHDAPALGALALGP